jgi:FkbM family methyltransferase
MSIKWDIVQLFDHPGGRWILGKLATQIARRKLNADVEIFYDQLWIHRLGSHYYPDGLKISDIRFREDRYEDYINTAKDYWFHYFHPQNGVVDVGAGHGEDTLAFSQAVGDKGKVVAIEAHPLSFKYLELFCRLNGLPNTIPLHACVMDKAGKAFMIEVKDNWQANLVDLNGHPRSIEVPALTLDEISANLNIKDIEFLKMNIEGAERYALLGMKQLVQHVKMICIACHDFLADSGQGENFRTRTFVEQFLVEHGFNILSRPNDPRSYIRDIIYGKR